MMLRYLLFKSIEKFEKIAEEKKKKILTKLNHSKIYFLCLIRTFFISLNYRTFDVSTLKSLNKLISSPCGVSYLLNFRNCFFAITSNKLIQRKFVFDEIHEEITPPPRNKFSKFYGFCSIRWRNTGFSKF